MWRAMRRQTSDFPIGGLKEVGEARRSGRVVEGWWEEVEGMVKGWWK